MLPVEEAIHRVIESVRAVGIETVSLDEGSNRILAAHVVAPIDLPPFTYATVDGFAIHRHDVERSSMKGGTRPRVIETIRAGSRATQTVKPGLAIRLMTGAPLPSGADAVVKEEDTSESADEAGLIRVQRPVVSRENVAESGEEVSRGDIVLKKGTTLRPGTIGILASLGFREVVVFRKPEIALLSTGHELVALGEDLDSGKIFGSSIYLLLAKLKEGGCTPIVLGVGGDDLSDIEKRIRSGLAADAIITTGGTGQGDSDWVRQVAHQMKIDLKVDGVAISPGKSFIFGLLRGKPVFSLPGSPTACLVAFEELVWPSLLKMRGKAGAQTLSRPTMRMSLEGRIRAKRGLREYALARVVLKDGRFKAIPIPRHHRGALMPTIQANGIVVLPEDRSEVQGGEEVSVRLVDLDL
jgi:molybdopterin molybdotransferase